MQCLCCHAGREEVQREAESEIRILYLSPTFWFDVWRLRAHTQPHQLQRKRLKEQEREMKERNRESVRVRDRQKQRDPAISRVK
jgi:hypothetical protein